MRQVTFGSVAINRGHKGAGYWLYSEEVIGEGGETDNKHDFTKLNPALQM